MIDSKALAVLAHSCMNGSRDRQGNLRYFTTLGTLFYLNRAEGTWLGMAKSLRSKRKQKIKRLRKQLFYDKDKAKEQQAMETTEGSYTVV